MQDRAFVPPGLCGRPGLRSGPERRGGDGFRPQATAGSHSDGAPFANIADEAEKVCPSTLVHSPVGGGNPPRPYEVNADCIAWCDGFDRFLRGRNRWLETVAACHCHASWLEVDLDALGSDWNDRS